MDVLPSEMPAVTSAASSINHGAFTAAETMVVPSAVSTSSGGSGNRTGDLSVNCGSNSAVATPAPAARLPLVDNIALPPSSKSVIDSTTTQLAQDTIVTAGHLSSKSTPQVSLVFAQVRLDQVWSG